MSWLARSITNHLRIDDTDTDTDTDTDGDHHAPVLNDDVQERQRGMKEDLTEFRQSLTRQLRDVANFLAPVNSSESTRSDSPDPSISGADSSSVHALISTAPGDHSETGVLYPVMNQILDNNCRLNQLGFGNADYVVGEDDDCDDEVDNEGLINDAGGLTDEVLTFAGNIAHHPETWLDFPVEDDEDLEDFPMSESQKKHAQAIEYLTPRLAALRIELCPAHMSEGFFWKVYFVLLHSRLNKQDAELLSTPEVVEARTKWMQELHEQDKKGAEHYHLGRFPRLSADLDEDITPNSLQNEHSETLSSRTFHSEAATSFTTTEADSDYQKQLVSSELQYTNKSNNINEEKALAHTDDKNTVIAPVSKMVINFDDDDDGDDWPEDDCLGQNATIITVGIDDEVSFSDLEDDGCSIPVKSEPQGRG